MTTGRFSIKNKGLLNILGVDFYPIDHLTYISNGHARFLYDLLKGNMINIFYCWVPYRVGPAHMHCQSSFMSLVPRVFKFNFPFIEKWPNAWEGLTSLNEKWCKAEQACLTCWRKRKERRKGHSALCGSQSKTKSHSAVLVWVPQRAKHKWELQLEEVQSVWRNKEKHSKSVREWKRKMRHFSLLKLHTRKINWWSSHGVFEYYNHGELEYLEEDFATGFVVRLYLLLEIYLLYIQFIVDTSLV